MSIIVVTVTVTVTVTVMVAVTVTAIDISKIVMADVLQHQEAVDSTAIRKQKHRCRTAQLIQKQCPRPMALPMCRRQVATALVCYM